MEAPDGGTTQSSASAISNWVVRTTREYTGRGATRAHTHLDDDLVTVVLTGVLTKGEHSLIDNGRQNQVQAMRLAFQQSMRAELIGGVEAILGRKVIPFMSANHLDPDMAIESFVLQPRT